MLKFNEAHGACDNSSVHATAFLLHTCERADSHCCWPIKMATPVCCLCEEPIIENCYYVLFDFGEASAIRKSDRGDINLQEAPRASPEYMEKAVVLLSVFIRRVLL
ncbi:hypothetical protein PoB_001309000 [Plakobranchus ocellatus]|uniref:Protein kinase domain-containing protein n=1 Tax=Plakobranchus ocellatus TaxID=259542 RepID=A0AAV3YTR5_9GAST|nr:hypothetical protein PoB_001309000 [Plakobranchus ocellatus]